ncbi:DNA recombination protein RmuC [Puniceicoccus vermicola]|uniref:DNA recombination protein RmuC n=1 Tax=Puniceicoccus vermicola TaxID=388746 RepID=A0A7X1AYK8_9BACT|nr:DNA recombination protein RmuC [Puniceicoccus vermicola]MBC2602352.1 DNA recombination protein RmuC [Puniceicoccus vermicola]
MDPIYVILLLLVMAGLAIALFFVGKSSSANATDPDSEEELARWKEEAVRKQTQLEDREQRLAELEKQRERDQSRILALSENLSSMEADLENSRSRLDEYKAQREEEAVRLTKEFENLSNRILDQNSKKVTALQEEKIGLILKPVSEKLVDFQKSVLELKEQGISHQTEFKTQLENLRQTSVSMSEEARNLTRALQGQKTQGMWGEFILEKVLETSGLQKGEEYRVQESHTQDGRRLQPDVIVYLPEEKHIIIDAKVSLTAYLRVTEAATDGERKAALKDHLASLRSHIDGLSGKRYDAIEGLSSPEIVLLFIPIEPAFIEALREDSSLFDYAFSKKVVLVTPTTLLATLKTVASIWRQEKQNRNALEIARLGGELYDKFVGFTNDLDEVGQRLDQARNAHEKAVNKLVSGRGNAVRTIERMRDLGLKTKKELDSDRIDKSLESEE